MKQLGWLSLGFSTSLFASLWAFAYLELGPKVLYDGDIAMNAEPFPSWYWLTTVVMQVLLLLGLLPRLFGFLLPRWPKVQLVCASLVAAAVWFYMAYAIADNYSIYFGNTWTVTEIALGFVLFGRGALVLMVANTLVYALSYRELIKQRLARKRSR